MARLPIHWVIFLWGAQLLAKCRATELTNHNLGYRVVVLVTNQPARPGMGIGWGEPMCLGLTADGSFLFIERGGAVKWWDSSTGTTIERFERVHPRPK